MLSILIPIYNRDVTKLVEELLDQCGKANIPFEILCFDDGSTEKWKKKNKVINARFGVNYVETQYQSRTSKNQKSPRQNCFV